MCYKNPPFLAQLCFPTVLLVLWKLRFQPAHWGEGRDSSESPLTPSEEWQVSEFPLPAVL